MEQNLIWFPIIELTLILGGALVAYVVGTRPDREARADQELRDVEAWLEQMWAAKK